MFVLILSTAVVSSSCSSDDNDDNNGLTGTWTCDNHYYAGSDTFVFNSNGTFAWSYSGSWHFEDLSGDYAFDSSRSILTIHSKKGTTWVYVIVSLTPTSFTMMDEDGDTYYYRKK